MYAQWRSVEDYQAMRQDPGPLPFLEEALTIAVYLRERADFLAYRPIVPRCDLSCPQLMPEGRCDGDNCDSVQLTPCVATVAVAKGRLRRLRAIGLV
jgi:hypothetical protein